MNWPRIILDGLSMSLLFNMGAGLGFLLWPQAYSTMFPREIKRAAMPYVDRRDVRKMKLFLYSLLSMLLGCLAMFLFAFGYLALVDWMRAFSEPCALLMLISTVMVLTFGMAHHVFCGVPEWLYVKLGRTEEARQLIREFFKKTSVTLIVCYLGFLIFSVSFFVPVVSGWTPLPRWACVFNILPLMLALMPTRVGGSGNWAGAVMFLGLLFLF